MTKTQTNQIAPAPPKRPLSAFFLYRAEKYPLITSSHPNLKLAEITQVISTQWREETPESKALYQDRYNADKVVFDQKMKEYIALHGKPAKKQKKVKKVKALRADKKERKGKKEKRKARRAAKKEKAQIAERKQSK